MSENSIRLEGDKWLSAERPRGKRNNGEDGEIRGYEKVKREAREGSTEEVTNCAENSGIFFEMCAAPIKIRVSAHNIPCILPYKQEIVPEQINHSSDHYIKFQRVFSRNSSIR